MHAQHLPLAACLLIESASGEILAVSRRNSTTLWGLPGGKADGEESTLEAVIRETREEIGFEMSADDLELVFSKDCNNPEEPRHFRVATFRYTAPAPRLECLCPETGLAIRYLDRALLMNDTQCPFAAYNRGLFSSLANGIQPT